MNFSGRALEGEDQHVVEEALDVAADRRPDDVGAGAGDRAALGVDVLVLLGVEVAPLAVIVAVGVGVVGPEGDVDAGEPAFRIGQLARVAGREPERAEPGFQPGAGFGLGELEGHQAGRLQRPRLLRVDDDGRAAERALLRMGVPGPAEGGGTALAGDLLDLGFGRGLAQPPQALLIVLFGDVNLGRLGDLVGVAAIAAFDFLGAGRVGELRAALAAGKGGLAAFCAGPAGGFRGIEGFGGRPLGERACRASGPRAGDAAAASGQGAAAPRPLRAAAAASRRTATPGSAPRPPWPSRSCLPPTPASRG